MNGGLAQACSLARNWLLHAAWFSKRGHWCCRYVTASALQFMLHVTPCRTGCIDIMGQVTRTSSRPVAIVLVSKAWASLLRCVGSVGPYSMAAGKQVPPFGRNDKALENGISVPTELRRAKESKQLALWQEPLERGRIWQPRFYDFVVFSEAKRVEKLRYIHRNPVKRGLVLEPQQWAWSSFRYYAFDEPRPVVVNEPQKAELRVRKVS